MLYATSFDPVVGTTASGTPFKPTTGELYEAGIKYQPTGTNIFAQLSVFDLTQQNVPTPDPTNPFGRIQTGEIHAQGFEVEGRASVTNQLDVIVAYTYVQSKGHQEQ